ncbi:MAG: cation:proton antiporter, partial [Candidatus Nanohaloarchaea archaeon]|nr:cation:proton antiporter [Candidatus Nanohaloarchaea archaeon]
IQDIIVIFVLAAVASLGSSLQLGFVPASMRILTTFTLGVMLVIGTLLASKYVLAQLFRVFAESQEAFFVASLGWCMGLILLAQQASLSIEIGAFLAGISLAQLPYNQELKERVRPVTDVFVAIFFASLGLQINLFSHADLLIPALTLSAAIMSIKFLVI